MQADAMRANVHLDAEAYTFASTYASAKGIPLGAAISELLRRAEQVPEPVSPLLTKSRLGLLIRAKRLGTSLSHLRWSKSFQRTILRKNTVHLLDVNVVLALLDQRHAPPQARGRLVRFRPDCNGLYAPLQKLAYCASLQGQRRVV